MPSASVTATQVNNGDLIKGRGAMSIYYIEAGKRRWVPDAPTVEARGGWAKVRTLDDEAVRKIPLGEQLKSVIQLPPRPDGTLVAGSGPEIYVIIGGTRRWVPDPQTFEAKGYKWDAVEQISDVELNAIPVGIVIQPVRRIEAQADTDLGAGHFMSTGAAIDSQSGVLKATTRTRSVTWFGGFTGGVIIIFGDATGVAIGSTKMQTFGVDGTMIGTSDRTEYWTEAIDQNVAAHATNLTIVHAWAPKVSMKEIVDQGIKVGTLVVEIVRAIAALA